MFFCILVHDYTLCFISSPFDNVGCYNYNSYFVLPYYIVIHLLVDLLPIDIGQTLNITLRWWFSKNHKQN